jgi:hypothetical protein
MVDMVRHDGPMVDTAALLAAYDTHMWRPPGAVPAGMTYELDGPVLRMVGGHMGRIRAPRDVGVTGAELDRLIARQRDYFAARGEAVEWKTRAHDLPEELPERLVAAGFVADEEQAAVLIGFAEELAAEPVQLDGVVLRQVSEAADLRRIGDLQGEVWGIDGSWIGDDLIARVAADPELITVLVAEAGDRMVCAAWSVYHPGTEFVAMLGGATVPDWRRRGIYRATVVARARAAVARGYRLMHVDAGPDSAPLLRRWGFHEITTSRHYQWTPEKVLRR